MGRDHQVEQQQTKTAATRDRGRSPAQHTEAPGQALAAAMAGRPSPGTILALQRAVGNAAVNRLLRGQTPVAPVQRTVAPAAPGPVVQRADEDEDEDAIQTMPGAQRLHSASAPATGDQEDIGARIRAARGGGSALDSGVRRTLETGLGASLSGVRVHTGVQADHLSRSVQAVAFTTGSDIFFRSGAYNPSTPGGLRLLAHEATHTVQQAAGPVAGTPHPGGVSISGPADSFERAAEASAARVTAGVTGQAAQRAAIGSTSLQRWAGTSTTHATPVQRVWDFNNPAWGTTQRISTVTSGQAVLFMHDDTNDTIVVKGEDTPIGMTTLVAGVHQQIHGTPSVRTKDVTGAKATITALLNDPAKTSDASWTALGNYLPGQKGMQWIDRDLAKKGITGAAVTPEIRARFFQQYQMSVTKIRGGVGVPKPFFYKLRILSRCQGHFCSF